MTRVPVEEIADSVSGAAMSSGFARHGSGRLVTYTSTESAGERFPARWTSPSERCGIGGSGIRKTGAKSGVVGVLANKLAQVSGAKCSAF